MFIAVFRSKRTDRTAVHRDHPPDSVGMLQQPEKRYHCSTNALCGKPGRGLRGCDTLASSNCSGGSELPALSRGPAMAELVDRPQTDASGGVEGGQPPAMVKRGILTKPVQEGHHGGRPGELSASAGGTPAARVLDPERYIAPVS